MSTVEKAISLLNLFEEEPEWGLSDLARYDVIWAAGGVPRAVFPISYDELVRVTAGTPTEVA